MGCDSSKTAENMNNKIQKGMQTGENKMNEGKNTANNAMVQGENTVQNNANNLKENANEITIKMT